MRFASIRDTRWSDDLNSRATRQTRGRIGIWSLAKEKQVIAGRSEVASPLFLLFLRKRPAPISVGPVARDTGGRPVELRLGDLPVGAEAAADRCVVLALGPARLVQNLALGPQLAPAVARREA
eukprot:509155-Pyramimonas_sp.AAC.1